MNMFATVKKRREPVKSIPRTPIVLLFVWFLMPAVAAAQSGSPRPRPVAAGGVVIAVSSDPGGLNPAITTQGTVHLITGSIFSGLVAIDMNLKPVPDLATDWEISPDGRRYTFHLAPAARFHDGRPVTAADVQFTFEQLLLKYHSRTRTAIGDKLRTIAAPDARTVVFEFAAPCAAFLQLVDVTNAPVMPKHLYENTDPLTNPHNIHPVGCGPFVFEQWTKGDSVVLRRNPDYFKPGRPALERVVFRIMPSAASAAIALETGEVDFLMNPAPLDVRRFRARADLVVTDKGREGYATVETMVPNLTRAPLSDLRVRQALAHAINRRFLVDQVQFGQARVATGPVSSLLAWACNPNVTRYEHDPARAARLLDEAGYKPGPGGVRFRLKTLCSSGWMKTAEALRDQFREIGVALDLDVMEFSAMVERTYIQKDFDLSFSSFENGPDPDIGVKRTVLSSNIGPIPFSNGAGYRNPRVDALFAQASSTLAPEVRARLYFEAQDILTRELAYFWLYEPRAASVYHAALQGVYEWSAKSNVHFAQDARWATGTRPPRPATAPWSGRLLVLLVVVAGLWVARMMWKRSGG
jgi:peptide/nickel transport system substrate-binding protein